MEFEKAFSLEDDSEEPSGTNTPAVVEEKAAMGESEPASGSAEANEKGDGTPVSATSRTPNELPPEVRSKLRKLETLESKYKGTWN